MLFCFKLVKLTKETYEMLNEVNKDEAITSKSVYGCFRRSRHHQKNKKITKVRLEKLGMKTRLIAFFDSKGLIPKEFLPESTTLNAVVYAEAFNATDPSHLPRERQERLLDSSPR
ncbi:hypothetical protein TNCV_507971 [Trichonephila clavipes]|nr:hypothetical protein TNCV_507971 [Trichonephila clavipes]